MMSQTQTARHKMAVFTDTFSWLSTLKKTKKQQQKNRTLNQMKNCSEYFSVVAVFFFTPPFLLTGSLMLLSLGSLWSFVLLFFLYSFFPSLVIMTPLKPCHSFSLIPLLALCPPLSSLLYPHCLPFPSLVSEWVSSFVGALSPVNHKGLRQGWTQTSLYLQVIHFTSHDATSIFFF